MTRTFTTTSPRPKKKKQKRNGSAICFPAKKRRGKKKKEILGSPRIQPRKQMNITKQSRLLLLARCIRELGHGGMKQLPGGTAQVCLCGSVLDLACYHAAFEDAIRDGADSGDCWGIGGSGAADVGRRRLGRVSGGGEGKEEEEEETEGGEDVGEGAFIEGEGGHSLRKGRFCRRGLDFVVVEWSLQWEK